VIVILINNAQRRGRNEKRIISLGISGNKRMALKNATLGKITSKLNWMVILKSKLKVLFKILRKLKRIILLSPFKNYLKNNIEIQNFPY